MKFIARMTWCLVAASLVGCASFPRLTRPPGAPPDDAQFVVSADDDDQAVRLYTAVVEPNGPARGVVFFVLGAETPAAPPYPKFTAALREAGFATAVVHARGTGWSDGLRGDADDFSRVLGDYHFFLSVLLQRFPRVFVMGQSAGGAFALEVAAKSPQPLAGVVLVNPAWKLQSSKGMTPSVGDVISFAFNLIFRPAELTVDMNSRPEAVEFGPDREEALAMRRDPLTVRYFSMRYLTAQGDVMARCPDNAAASTAPLLVVQGAHDALIDPSSLDTLLAKSAASDKQKLVAPEGGHGSTAVETQIPALLDWLVARSTQ